MYDRSAIPKLVIYSVLSLVLTLFMSTSWAQQNKGDSVDPVYMISDFKSDITNNTLSIEIMGDTIPAFTVSEEFAPFTVILDISGAVFADVITPNPPTLQVNTIAKMSIKDLATETPGIKRFSFQLADTHDYKINRAGNGIKINIYPSVKQAEESSAQAAITDIKISKDKDITTIDLMSAKTLTDYKVGTLAGDSNQPARLYIDIPDVSITNLVREKKIDTAVSRIRVAPRGTGARFVIDSVSSELFPYDVKSTPDSLQVIVSEVKSSIVNSSATKPASPPGTNADDTLDELIESSTGMLSGETIPPSEDADNLQDTFSFSGYNKQRISIDFYKIDIHNVFRLFRQITDLNIIVDQGVSGTLTLALTDVPWDFALDIILNLLDLEKEERFNTIVIYPKKKAFLWPERAEDNLSFEADVEVVEQEALIISESANQSKEIIKAKELLVKAQEFLKSEDYEDAAALYEQAGSLWPDNPKIYNKLATLYLVNLGMNAKSLYYAKESLKKDKSNLKAALYAAIASANMQRVEEASEYFTQAISGTPPMKEALFSFAAFSENNNKEEIALKLLDKYNENYGETVDTMLAKARLFDKLKQPEKATEQYKSIMASGYQLRPDLKKYILGRIAAGTN
ncbi:secretin and TonB N-terminal domain-containing protein [Desulfopila sp. IMCC35008]|uniref:secretin and TonB N-terminal domain-containing protein n=1 Tax=Desulfopila sp. IMCC35008 TaxID=2653858 RepID=UPI0013D82051|nr:secretin and TonB N-terminal domain-containing protein [Desulfopila sp. IMCC35008]